jgi:tape measure domain-containing protein
MATSLKELIVTYEANAKPVLDALDRIDSKINQTSKSLKKISDSFLSAGRDLSAALTLPLGLFAAKSLQASANFETLRMQMEVLTGSAEKGAEVFQRLVKFAVETPFELTEITKAQNTLMGFGESADDAYRHLKLIGDIAAVSGGNFELVALAFGQVSAAGKMMGNDMHQFINNGVPILKLLSDETGIAKEKIQQMVFEGKITFPILERAFQRATSKGGMFENGMARLSRTSKGVWSTFKDNVNIALSKFGDEMQKAFALTSKLEKFGQWIGKLADNFSRLAPETKRNIFLFLGLVSVIGPLLVIIGTLVRIISIAAIGFNVIITPIRFLISLFPVLMMVARAFMLVFLANPLTAFIAATIAIVYYWKEIVHLFEKAVGWFKKLSIEGVWDKIKDFAGNVTAELSGNSGAASAVSSVSNNSSSINNQKTVSNNLTVNIPAGMSASDSNSLKNAVKAAMQEENRQSYMEVATQ